MLTFPSELVDRRMMMPVFAVAELMLLMAIPFLVIDGYHTFLSTDAGTFVEDLAPTDPGYRSFVTQTEVIPVLERAGNGELKQISLVAANEVNVGLMKLPVSVSLGTEPISSLTDAQIQTGLSELLRMDLAEPIDVGVGGSTAAVAQVAQALPIESVDLPLAVDDSGVVTLNGAGLEQALLAAVDYPSHATRLNVNVVNQVSGAVAADTAAVIAASGYQVEEVGNANIFSLDSTTLAVPEALIEDPEVLRLSNQLGTDILVDELAVDQDRVTLLVGADFSLQSN